MFEVQRVVKRLKAAVGEEERTDLETQLEALKEISHGVVAAIAIRSKLAKAKLLPKSVKKADSAAHYPLMTMVQELQDLVAGGAETVSHPGAEKATAKLLSNKVVSEEVSKAVKDLRALFEERPSIRREDEAKSAGRRAGKADHNVGRQEAKNDDDDDGGREGDRWDRRSAEVTAEADRGREERVHNAQSSHASTANGKRGADQDHSGEGRPRKQVRIESDDESGMSKGEDSNEGESTGDSEQDGGEHDGDLDADLSRLPALSTGFVAGRGLRLGRASDEEWSDGDADSIDEGADVAGMAKESKKNRMGQRARRA